MLWLSFLQGRLCIATFWGYVSKSVSALVFRCLYSVGMWNSFQSMPVPYLLGVSSSLSRLSDASANSPFTSSSVGITRRISAASKGLSGLIAPTLELLLFGRFILGIAIAGIATASAALASEYYDEGMRAKVYGRQSAASGVSVLILETSGGFLSLMGWRAPFLVYLVGFVLLVLAALFIREAGQSSATAETLNAMNISESPAGEMAQASAALNATNSKGVLKAVGFVVIACFVAAFLSQTMSYLVPSKMPYLITVFGESSLVSGLFLGGFGIANIIGSLASPRLQVQVPHSFMVCSCFISMVLGCVLMSVAPGIWVVLAGAVFIGLGVGCVTPLLMALVAARSTHETSGKHMGALAMACNLGQFACTLLAGTVMAFAGSK